MVKDIRQGDKDQARSGGRAYAERKTCRENDQTGHDCYKGIQNRNICRFSKQRSFFSDIASEDRHSSDTKTQCKECLVHRRYDRITDAQLFHSSEVRNQIELQSFCCSVHRDTVDCQHYHDGKQCNHHYFCDFFQTILQTSGTYKDTNGHYNDHPESHNKRL